jgi:DNA mismatch repair protein MSH3
LIQVLDALLQISNAFHKAFEPRFESDLLNRLFDSLSTMRDQVIAFKEAINPNYSGKDMVDFFASEEKWPEIPREKQNIQFIELVLQDHIEELKTATQLRNLKYVTVAGLEYLLEVANTDIKKVPTDWIKISGTKAVSRFQNKFIIDQLKEREQHRELLVISADKAYKNFLM